MSDRRNRPPNRWGCKPTEDVCVEHDEPLICRHGCTQVKHHGCKDCTETAGAAGWVVPEPKWLRERDPERSQFNQYRHDGWLARVAVDGRQWELLRGRSYGCWKTLRAIKKQVAAWEARP